LTIRGSERSAAMSRIVEPSETAIAEAARVLAAGGLIALPTETVYGLGADTFNADALRAVYAIKGRPLDNPLIAHVLDPSQARRLVRHWSERAEALAQQFWPGPLTLILERGETVPNEATAGRPTIAVRSPSHAVARTLLGVFGRPISAPSANRSGHVSPTRAAHVADDFADEDLLILDGGPSECGIESTVVDLTVSPPRILRPGSISEEQVAATLAEPVLSPTISEQEASPGTSARHYAPRTPVELLDRGEIERRLRNAEGRAVVLVIGSHAVAAPHAAIPMPDDPRRYASHLYETLRRADALGANVILIERPPSAGPLWTAIINRLDRAASRG